MFLIAVHFSPDRLLARSGIFDNIFFSWPSLNLAKEAQGLKGLHVDPFYLEHVGLAEQSEVFTPLLSAQFFDKQDPSALDKLYS